MVHRIVVNAPENDMINIMQINNDNYSNIIDRKTDLANLDRI